MKRVFLILTMLLALVLPLGVHAAELSDDKMTLDWTTSKVWMVGDELCVQGTFTNKRDDLRIIGIKDMTMRFVFTQEDGTVVEHIAKAKAFPICKIPPNGTKKLTLNFGKYGGSHWRKWVTTQEYIFSYQPGMRW